MRKKHAHARGSGVGGNSRFSNGVAVLGTGSIGSRHLKVLREMPGIFPVAVTRRNHRQRFWRLSGLNVARGIPEAASYGIRRAIIATDTREHLRNSLEALQAGMDLLVEKPLASNVVEGRQIHCEANRQGRLLFVGFPLRFSPSLAHTRRLLPQLGGIHSVRIECRSFLPDWRPARSFRRSYSARSVDGGVLRDLIHEIDYAGWFFGWPEKVYASLSNVGRLKIESEEIAHLHWCVPHGPSVSVDLDYLTWPSLRRMGIFGERGTLRWDGISQEVNLSLRGQKNQHAQFHSTMDQMLGDQDAAFLSARVGNCDPRLVTGKEALRALALCDAARESSEKRKPVKLRIA